ncbi:MAG: hypothetical protein Q8P67_14165 [archaeon]|nr:hypothetical protein [archaeon]
MSGSSCRYATNPDIENCGLEDVDSSPRGVVVLPFSSSGDTSSLECTGFAACDPFRDALGSSSSTALAPAHALTAEATLSSTASSSVKLLERTRE